MQDVKVHKFIKHAWPNKHEGWNFLKLINVHADFKKLQNNVLTPFYKKKDAKEMIFASLSTYVAKQNIFSVTVI